MKRLSMILLGVLTLPAYGEIASVRGTDSKIAELSKTIESKADKSGYTPNMLLQTDTDGKVTATTLKTNMIENGAVTNSKLASNIGMDKLNMGTLPTSGKHILVWNSATNKYVFEELIKPRDPLQCPAGQYDFGFSQCVDPSVQGTGYDYYGYYSHDGVNKKNKTIYNLSAGEWAVEFSYGTIYGSASCNSTHPRDYGVVSWNNDSSNWLRPGDTFDQSIEGGNCWCKMTSPAVSLWVYKGAHSPSSGTPYSDCAAHCAGSCGNSVRSTFAFRSRVFSSVGN